MNSVGGTLVLCHPLLPQAGAQLASFVLHGQAILRGHVQRMPRHFVELQPLQQDGQEEEDLNAANSLTNAATFAHTKQLNLLCHDFVDLSSIGA